MNIVCSEGRYQIFGDELKTFSKLPPGTYDVGLNKMTGFFLSGRADIEVGESKIYGNRDVKVRKVMRSFEIAERNLGVILSGKKGIGKTLFARMIAEDGVRHGYPVVTVSQAYQGLSTFLQSIEQDIIVIFDEFDKTFCTKNDEDDEDGHGPQEELLTLFDGLSTGKKLFVVTCNEYDRLSAYFKNRPGRFQYHITIGNPTVDEVREYLTDKISPEYADVIERIVGISVMKRLNYDCLRAICFDINQGYSLEDVLEDINITMVDSEYYKATYFTPMGVSTSTIYGDLFDSDREFRDNFYLPPEVSVTVNVRKDGFTNIDGKLVAEGDVCEVVKYSMGYDSNILRPKDEEWDDKQVKMLTPHKVVIEPIDNGGIKRLDSSRLSAWKV